MAANFQSFSFEEVSKHNHKKDCWIIIHGKVYDVTPFLDDHPGGEVVLSATEKDATDDFEVSHSDSAKEMMQKYFVGEVDTSSLPPKPPKPAQVPPHDGDQSSVFVVKILQYLVTMLIMGLAFALQYYGKNSKSKINHEN